MEIVKNRERKEYSFANINLLGNCNVDCYFCLGKDLETIFKQHNQLNIHFTEWKNFDVFINNCKENNVQKLYITGQNCDSLQYKYLEELVDYLQDQGFLVGLRTNGYLAYENMGIINKCKEETGYSINSLNAVKNQIIMKRWDIPRWDLILKETQNSRVSVVINRHNVTEFLDIVRFVSQFDKVRYVQARRISTDTRVDELMLDVQLYEMFYKTKIAGAFSFVKEFYGAQIHEIYGKEVTFWRTVETSVNSLNYFTDGTVSDEYFIIEGYLKNMNK